MTLASSAEQTAFRIHLLADTCFSTAYKVLVCLTSFRCLWAIISLILSGVFGGNLDGNDMTRDCSDPECNRLEPDNWVCFYSPIDWE